MPTNQEQENPFAKYVGQDNTGNPFAIFAEEEPQPANTSTKTPNAQNPFAKYVGQDNTGNPFAIFAEEEPQPEPVPQPEAKPSSLFGGISQWFEKSAVGRGWGKTKNAVEMSGKLVSGDYEALADLVAQADEYNRQNPSVMESNPHGKEIATAWADGGEGLSGAWQGTKNVLGEIYKDWQEAPNVVGGMRALGRNAGVMGEGLLEQVPYAVPGMGSMATGALAGGAAGSVAPFVGTVAGATAGAFVGASAGNASLEAGMMTLDELRKAGVNPQDRASVIAFLQQHGDRILQQGAIKGTVLGAVDTATMGLGGKILNAPARAATERALKALGVDAADKQAVKTAMQSQAFKDLVANDAVYQAATKGAGNLGRNAFVAALEPLGEFAGEYAGTGLATGEWDAKGAVLEGISSVGQSAGVFAGQKAFQYSTNPLRGRRQDGAAADDRPGEGPDEGPQAAAPAAQQAFSREGYVQYRRTLESGGNPQAKAKTSSAFGIDQFLDGTWLDVVAQAKPDWAEGLTREQLLAQRANPQRSGEMADFLDRQNAQRLQSQGLEVNNHNLYAMHHFGAKGLTFAKAAMDAPMAQILTEAQLKANPYLAKMSKAQLIAHWDKRAGVPTAAGHDTPSTRVQIDDAADARAAEIEVLQSMGENLTDAQRARLGQLQAEEAAAQPARSFEQELAEAAELDGQAQQAQQAGQAQNVPGRAAEMVLQNRDRSTAASIEQMNAIAAKPDYLRTGPSRTMDQGAPVVFGDFPASSILGREETVADGRGDRVKTRYAVVDAADVIPSNTADGLPVQSYAAGEPGKLRAVAGNGRAAGLIEAYNRGTASQYRQELMEDAQSLGIEPAHIERLQSPMLVRIMDEADVTPDIGDRSNTAATARLSPLEEASNDAKRVNLAALEFGEDGSPSAASLRGFINAMPEAERGNMLGPDGAPTRQAVDRLMAAAFKQAYGNDELVKLHAQATDPEARTVMAALADSAGAMAQLAGAGEFDIRQAVADAAALAVNARRKGRTLAQEVQNLDLDMNPEALVIAQFMAQNIRSARRIADGLRNFAQRALQQVQIAQQNAVQGGMFGDQPTLTRKQLFEEFGNAHQQPAAQPGATRAESGQAPAAQPGRAGPDAQLAQPERAHARAAGDRPADRAQGGAAAGQDGRVEAAAGAAAGPGSADRPDVRLSRQKGQAQELGQTQQQYKDTERAYGGKAAWEKAKAEGQTKLTYHQWVQVRTPAFKKWWGYDWQADQANERTTGARGTGAVAQSSDRGGDRGLAQGAARGFPFVSPNGEPRVFYHGTRDAFSAFDVEHPNKKDVGWLGRGHYVTSDRWTAEYYAKAKRGESAPRVMELFARPFNALELTQEDKARFKNLTAKGAQSLSQQLLAKGYGGTYTIDDDGGIEFAVFDARGLKSATGNSGDFDAQNPDIRYSRRQQAAGQQRAEQVRRTVDGIRRHWKNAPEVVVAASLHDEAIPEELRSAVQAKQGQGAPEGFFHDGKVYLIADRLPKPRDVARVLLHEALGHWGLRGVFGKRLTLVLRDIQAARPQEVIAKAREYGLHGLGQAKEASNSEIWKSMSQEQRDEAAEEVLASMAQHQPQLGFVRRAVAAMRSWLREHVPLFNELALTQDEIVNNYLLPARRWVERSAKAGVAGGRPALSRSRPRPASDAEKARILQGEPVARLATKDAPSGSYADVVQAVARMFARQGGVATRQDIGEVVLDERAAKSSMAHGGANAYKRAAFAAVKDVIERGAVVMQAQHARDGTSFYIAAPVTIDGSDNMVTVLVRKDANTQRMYLHSVMLKENLLKPSVSAADAEASEPHSATTSGDAQSIAQNTHEREAVESPLKRRVSSVDAKASERSGSSASGDSWSIAQNAHKREATKSLLDLRVSRTDTASGVERSGSTNQEGKATVPPSPQEGKADSAEVADELRRLLTLDVQAGPQDIRFSRSQRVRAAANAALDKVGDWMDDSLEIPEHWSPAEKSAASKFDRYSKKQPLSERVSAATDRAVDRQVQGWADQFRPLKGLSETAWMQAQLSKGTDGAVEAVATLGIPYLKDGAIAVDTEKYPDGFLGELAKLGSVEEVRRFFKWVVGNRADRLSKEWTVTYADGTTVRYKDQATALQAAKGKPGAKAQAASRENLFNAEEIKAMTGLLYGQMPNGKPRPEAYHNALVALNRYNRAILDIAEAAGEVDPESRKQWESDFYVPFYRVSAENNTAFDFSSKGTGLARQQVIRRLEGGTDKLGDPLENLMANWHAMLTASMRNLAANNALNAAQSMGEARQVKEPVEGGTWTMQGGKKVYWQVDDPLVLIALESLNFNGYNHLPLKLASQFKRMLTTGVTAGPPFRIRSLIRDTLQAMATADVGYMPIWNIIKGFWLTRRGSNIRAQLIAGGGTVRFGSFNDGDQARNYERVIAMGIKEDQILNTPEKVRRFFGGAWNWYQRVGDRAEMVNRAVLYQRTLAKTNSHLKASFEARDLMNYTSMGSFVAARVIAQTVPFANARTQGLDRLVRGAARDPRRFWAVTGVLSMASALLLLYNIDDDEYKAMPDHIRNTYWPVKKDGKWYYIPKPFEVGALGTIVERGTELMISDGDYQAKDFKDSVMSILMNSLSMDLMPQIFKPVYEVASNHDRFRGQAIEGMALERLLPEDRYDANTSAAAIAAGRALGASPKKIEHLIRGYFGWLGVQALNAGDWMARPMMDLPESPKSDLSSVNNWFVVGDMVKDSGTIPSKYAERFYRLQSEINEIYASASNARRLGELQRYQELVSRPEMAAYPVLHQAQKGVTLINQQMRLTLASSAPAAEKNRRLQELRARRDEIARRVDKIVREAEMGRKGG